MSAKGTSGSAKGRGGSERTDLAPAVAARRPEDIRNIALVGRSGSGKTMLAESLLAATGVITRVGSIVDGSTVSDSDPSEIRQQRSVALSVLPCVVDEIKVNLLDTPGYSDFIGDLRAGLRAADAALFVVSAVDGVDAATTALWSECDRLGMPRAVVISRVDHPRANYEGVLAACQDAFGTSVLPLYVPLRSAQTIHGLVGLLTGIASDYSAGSATPSTRAAIEDELVDLAAARNTLIEGIIAESEDETLMDRYLGGEEMDVDVLISDLETAVSGGSFYPVVLTAAESGVGTSEVLELITRAFPSPAERPVPAVTNLHGRPAAALRCDPNGPLVGEVVRTTIDSFLGRVCLVRIFSGTLRENSNVHIGGHGLADRGHQDHDSDERVTHLQSPLGSHLRAVPYCVAGDICALTKLSNVETGDTVSDRSNPLLVETWDMPEPLMPVAVQGASLADDDALARSMGKVAAVDPTLRVERNPETHQLILWCMGEAHAEVVLDRLRAQGVNPQTVEVITPLRETFATSASARGRYVKQSGGHGQFGVCEIEVEPLSRGTGFEFVNAIVGGVVPGQYVGSVEKGVRDQMQRGLVAGFPVVDIRVRLVGGKTHSVDSSDAAFQAAGALALREAALTSTIQLLEPVSAVTISVPDNYVGAVMTDLSSRRGHMTGTSATAEEHTQIDAEIPDAELLRYALDLRALTAGTGEFRRKYLRHAPVP